MTAFLDLELVGDAVEVERMLVYLDSIFSGPGVVAFLAGNVGPYLRDRARDRFFQEGDSASGAWAPLSPASQEVRSRLQVGADHPINRRTGELEEYITQSQWTVSMNALGATLSYPDEPPKTLSLKEKMRRAQEGSDHPPTVARPVLGVDEVDLAYVVSILVFFIQAGRVV
jgi:hypothetical protein